MELAKEEHTESTSLSNDLPFYDQRRPKSLTVITDEINAQTPLLQIKEEEHEDTGSL